MGSNVSLWYRKILFCCKKEYDNIKIIVYLRRQDRYLESHWNQRIKRAGYIVTDFSQYKDDEKFFYNIIL